MSSSDGDQSPTAHRPDPNANPTRATPSFPSREDCWSEEATRTLIEAWGSHYLELNKGNLRQKHWQEVADAVNSAHGLHRTDVQCKNRIDTTKKKYKVEKTRFLQSNGRHKTAWPHFDALDSLIGDSSEKNHGASHQPNGVERNLRPRTSNTGLESPPAPQTGGGGGFRGQLTWTVPVGPRSKRSWAPGTVTERNFSVMAAAAAAMEAQEGVKKHKTYENDDDGHKYAVEDINEDYAYDTKAAKKKRKVDVDNDNDGIFSVGYRRLAEAITRLAEIYERVEVAKQRQMIELEKQRMQFAKDLEIQRMKAFMDSQIQIEKIKRAKRHGKSNGFL